MESFSEVLRVAALAIYMTLGILTLRRWRERGSTPDGWAAATFLLLGTLTAVGVAADPGERFDDWFVKTLLVALTLFPYLLLRFVAAITPVSRRIEVAAAAATLAVAAWSLALGPIPDPGAPRPPMFLGFVIVFIAHWVGLLAFVGTRLWRAGGGLPIVARRRMRLLAGATLSMSVAIVVSGSRSTADVDATSIAIQLLSVGSAVLFFLGLVPPRWLRTAWRRREQDAVRRAVTAMMRATTAEEVARLLVPGAASLLAAPAAAMFDHQGDVLASQGDVESGRDPGSSHEVTLRRGRLVIRTSPYVSFFGADEVEELETLAQLGEVAIERCDRSEREREFISNAAHELRTPMTTLYGMSLTLSEHNGRMDETSRDETIGALVRQSTRAKVLVEDLLDLARVGHQADQLFLAALDARTAADGAIAAAPPPADARVEVRVERGLLVLGEKGALERILVNLLTNAYRHGGSSITIEARAGGDRAQLAVIDDGAGVPAELVASMFEPFSRGDRAGAPGSGLGLTISRRLADAMDGKLIYRRSGGRSRFVVDLRQAM